MNTAGTILPDEVRVKSGSVVRILPTDADDETVGRSNEHFDDDDDSDETSVHHESESSSIPGLLLLQLEAVYSATY
ncbi:unnamed protein product [Gongylonema pulchrum]|uniref:Uncharacterized protein n=1 Tax=Gongylonema pulchrum TaxID=637853 RepID=A0A183DA76_9BILA|nr:unnamed protein product [Gongylonema pulchrum]